MLHPQPQDDYHGLRTLLDVGDWSGTGARPFHFADQLSPGQQLRVVHVTTKGLVIMDRLASGSRCGCNLFHGRYNDGLTISVDLALRRLYHGNNNDEIVGVEHNMAIYSVFHRCVCCAGCWALWTVRTTHILRAQ